MRKNTTNFALDSVSFLLILTLACTGLIMEFVLPPGSGGDALWGLDRHRWGDIHFWVAVGMVAALILHLALHWSWAVCTLRRLNPFRTDRVRRGPHDTAWGLAFLAGIALAVGALVAVARTQVVRAPPGTEHSAPTSGEVPGQLPAEPGTPPPVP